VAIDMCTRRKRPNERSIEAKSLRKLATRKKIMLKRVQRERMMGNHYALDLYSGESVLVVKFSRVPLRHHRNEKLSRFR